MVSAEGILGEVEIPAVDVTILVRPLVNLLRELPEVGHVKGSVPTLEHRVSRRRLLLTLPEEGATQRVSQLGRQHLLSRRSW